MNANVFHHPLLLIHFLPHFHHYAHSVVPPFFETQLHASKLLTPSAIPHLHHWVLKLCFALDGVFHHLWHSFTLGPTKFFHTILALEPEK
jgi:hypothetical protein